MAAKMIVKRQLNHFHGVAGLRVGQSMARTGLGLDIGK